MNAQGDSPERPRPGQRRSIGRSPRERNSRRCRWSDSSASTSLADVDASRDRVPPGPEGSRLHRGPERRDRIRSGTVKSDRLPALVADLIRRPVAVIVGDTNSALAAKAATTTVPIVFGPEATRSRQGLVASFNRPGGNVTGVIFFAGVIGAKRLELLRQLVPKATTIAMLVNPNSPNSEAERSDVQARRKPSGSNSSFSMSAATATSRRPLQQSSNAGRCAARRFRRVLNSQRGTNRRAGGSPWAAHDICSARGRRGRWPDELRDQHDRCLSPDRHVRRADSQGREARGPAGHAIHQIRVRAQPQDRPRRSASKCFRPYSLLPTR